MSKSFVGYYCVIPISESAVKKLVSNEITGAGFISEHIVQANRDPYAVYLGGIAASGWLARGNLRSALHNEVFNHWAKKTRMAYTRPITQEGCRLIQKYNFTTVDPQNAGRMNSLYSRDLSHNNILRGNGLPYISSQ